MGGPPLRGGLEGITYLSGVQGGAMAVLIRRYKLVTGQSKEDRITEPERIERYLGMFERGDVKQLKAGQKVVIEKDEWQLLQ
jgi:hypothetical protein